MDLREEDIYRRLDLIRELADHELDQGLAFEEPWTVLSSLPAADELFHRMNPHHFLRHQHHRSDHRCYRQRNSVPLLFRCRYSLRHRH